MAVRDFIGNSVDSEVSAASVGISSAYTAVKLPPDVIVIINAVIARNKVLFFIHFPPEIILFK
ncbi:hypothetical protein RUMOBE_02953 [Blautia obeum ATCC 29174]|uniref:Uncharacterized protein n=1 Tax=Blautia obeum ATCC 29174 TaxID=411459 RepID=A5ZVB8_9FIRM|nr:hypothetical protein RUMOBE_02953 [Blautia obeum ATCC 29174]